MNINLITLAAVKTHLGLTSTTYDAQITAYLPIVSSDVRRILNEDFRRLLGATYSGGSTILFIGGDVATGQIVTGDGLGDMNYISAYDPWNGTYTLSAAPTASGSWLTPSIMLAQVPTIAKMVWYKISSANVESAGAEKLSSVSYGPVSKVYAPSEINNEFGYPYSLVSDLGYVNARVG